MEIHRMTRKVERASKYYLQKKYAEVIELLNGEDIYDNPHALMILGESYREVGNYEQACKYLQEAYMKGNVNAAYGLAVLYMNGIIVEKSEKVAYELLKEAAYTGNRRAMLDMAHYCHDNMLGEIGTQNRPEEKMWRELAQELPSARALFYHAQNMIYHSYDCGCTEEEIDETLQLAAVKDDDQAKSVLANKYAKNLEDTESLKKSLYWFYSMKELYPNDKRKLKEVEERLGI